MKLTPTQEQQDILDAVAGGGTVAISAGAGSGKTSTLKMIAQVQPDRKALYVAYNKAIQVEASKSFPRRNVTCKTAHSLAYRDFGAPMRDRLNGPRMPGYQVARALGIKSDFGVSDILIFSPSVQASMVTGMITNFCRSADPGITRRHFVPPEGLTPAETDALAGHLLQYAEKAWDDLTCGPKGHLKPTHDVYLKQWQLSNPVLADWDLILYDEVQDADPCIADVIERQTHAQLVAVGDSSQALFAWRGAGDLLARMNADYRLALTQSWRFGQAVADEANVWLDALDADLRVRGNPGRSSTLGPVGDPDAVLCRTNAGTVKELLSAYDAGRKAHLVGDGKDILSLAKAAERLQAGQPAGHPELVAFSSWKEVVGYAKTDPSGSDLAVAIRLIEQYGVETVIGAVESSVPAESADVVISTVHKSKGLEWGQVRISDDFPKPLSKGTKEPLPVPRPAAMVAYVAVTRAKQRLDTGGLSWGRPHMAALGTGNGTVPPETSPAAVADRKDPRELVYEQLRLFDEG